MSYVRVGRSQPLGIIITGYSGLGQAPRVDPRQRRSRVLRRGRGLPSVVRDQWAGSNGYYDHLGSDGEAIRESSVALMRADLATMPTLQVAAMPSMDPLAPSPGIDARSIPVASISLVRDGGEPLQQEVTNLQQMTANLTNEYNAQAFVDRDGQLLTAVDPYQDPAMYQPPVIDASLIAPTAREAATSSIAPTTKSLLTQLTEKYIAPVQAPVQTLALPALRTGVIEAPTGPTTAAYPGIAPTGRVPLMTPAGPTTTAYPGPARALAPTPMAAGLPAPKQFASIEAFQQACAQDGGVFSLIAGAPVCQKKGVFYTLDASGSPVPFVASTQASPVGPTESLLPPTAPLELPSTTAQTNANGQQPPAAKKSNLPLLLGIAAVAFLALK